MLVPVLPTKVEACLIRWQGVFTHTAAHMLIQHGCGKTVMDWFGFITTPVEVFHSSEFEDTLARDFGPVRFLGGPPGKRCLTKGSLLVVLVDRLLYDEATRC